MSPLWKSLALLALIAGVPSAPTSAADLEWVRVSDDGKGFVKNESGKPFIPWGFNYDHEGDGKLLEDYWDEQWSTVESAFQEMNELGANVVRIHLQFGTFMESPIKPRQHSLDQLSRLVKLAEQTGLYLDVTGLGCYHKPDVPAWYDKLSEKGRWATQAVFWEAVAKTCAESPAIFCYDLMNEPVVPGGDKQRDDWLGPGFGDKYFVQFIALDRKDRNRPDVARQWIRTLISAVRKHDKRHLITVGLVPWSLDRPGMTSGFVPEKIADDLDFIAMHIYPEKGKIDEAIETVKGFAAVGKPVVIEETFVLKCGADELEEFIDRSREHATGWIGFYWGKTPAEIRPAKTLPEAFTLSWLGLFQKKRTSVLDASPPKITIREIDGPIGHNHCTTRQFQHMSFHHQGVWFVFYSDGRDFRYQTSDDFGRTWKRADEPVASAPNGSSSFDVLKVGDSVYVSHAHYPLGRYDVNAPYAKDPSRRAEYTHEGRIKKGQIEGRRIRWSQDVNPGFTPDYCNMVQDSSGFFWVFTREDQLGTAHRSHKPNGIQEWMPQTICLPVKGRHALDAAALDDGKLYAVSLLTTDGKLYGNLYDGDTWGDRPVLIAENLTTVPGDDRRLAVEFDPTQKRLHLIYVDAENRLRYRHLDSPYQQSDWQPALSGPGMELGSGVFTAALSVDSSSTPYGLVITYGTEKHLGKDQRRRTGELYARRFDGQKWQSDPLLISQPGTIHNWYPNLNQDVKDGLCALYSRSIDKDNLGVPVAVMNSLVTDLSVTMSYPAAFLNNGVTAHRGNSGEYPENTIPAFQSGIDVGSDWIELDIFRTKDGQLVVTHDRMTKRVGDREFVVAESTYEELAKVDVATEFRRRSGKTVDECPPHRIPLLIDVLLLIMKQDRTRVSIQPKMDCVADAVALVKAMKAERWVGFNDGDLEYMAEVKRLAPDIPVFWDRGKDTNIDDDIAIAKKHGFEALVLHHEGVTSEKIQKIKAAAIEVGAWTVNDRATMEKLLDIGVERIYTDHPRLLLGLKAESEFQNIDCDGTYPHHLQGVCTDEKGIYWCFTTTLVKTDMEGNLLKKVPVANHHGDLCLHDGKLHVAVNLGKFNDPEGNADSWVLQSEISKLAATAMDVGLRDIERHDRTMLYEYQLDPEVNQLAATHPRSKDVFDAHWANTLDDPSVTAKAILVGDVLAGCISCFKSEERDSVGYWIGRKFWGQGVATRALELLLMEVPVRPLHARVAIANIASLRVLQKCGFVIMGYQHSPGDDRYQECEEAVLTLN